MNRRAKLFLFLSLALLLSDLAIVLVNYLSARESLLQSFRERGAAQRSAFTLAYNATLNNMLQMATFVSLDPRIQRLFLAGKEAVEAEGGGGGGPRAAAARAALMQAVGPRWKRMSEQFGVRQLHFHLGPGSLSFLRVHVPERFGDRMDGIRHIIEESHARQRPLKGFETGRIYSGLRGVVPLYAESPTGEGRIHVGTLETGTSFSTLFELVDRRLDSGIAAVLKTDHVRGAMWKEFIDSHFQFTYQGCGCKVEAQSRPAREVLSRLLRVLRGDPLEAHHTHWVVHEGKDLAVTHFPLFDYRGERDGGAPVGAILIWTDVAQEVAAYHRGIAANLALAAVAFVLLELLLYFSIGLATRRLEREVEERTVQLQAADQAKSDFLAAMSHEIRTPMNVVVGMTEVLLDGPLGAEQRHHVELLQHSGNALLELINDILDLSKIEAGHLELEQTDLPLHRLVEESAAVMRVRAEHKGLTLACRIDPTVPERVRGDGPRLRQILINLLGNAIKFTERGRVEVRLALGETQQPRARARGEHTRRLRFSVSDTGTGIAPEHLAAIFEEFTQGEPGTGRRYGGTGLGLAICKRLVERMGGVIGVESRPGEGSTFHFTLPLLPAREATPAPEPQTPAAAPVTHRPARILLVEDSPDNRALIAAYLKGSGHTLEQAADGEEGLARAKAGHFDLILMDVQLPGMDGYTAAAELRAWEQAQGRPAVPVLALTAHALAGDESKSLAAGCDAHLTKPIKKARLLEAITRHAAFRAAADQPEHRHAHPR